MRADRLISLMLLLQHSGPVTGERIAGELGVSPRTVYRDMAALDRIGIPVTAVSGPHGGYSLVEGYWNSFARLTTEEANAVIAAATADPFSELGVGPSLKRGLEKLAAQRSAAGQSTRTPQFDPESLLIDTRGWDRKTSSDMLPKLSALIAERRTVRLSSAGSVPAPWTQEMEIDPLGLVLKAGTWHLVFRRRELRVIELSAVTAVTPLDRRFAPPDGFDLSDFWTSWCDAQRTYQTQYRVELEVAAEDSEPISRFLAGGSAFALMRNTPGANHPTRVTIEAGFAEYEDARARIMGLGGAARVVSPRALALGIADYAQQIRRRYAAAR